MFWTRSSKKQLGALTALCLFLSGCFGENENVGDTPDYVTRSGMFVHPGAGDNHLDWLNEDTVVFTASISDQDSLLPKKFRLAYRWSPGSEPIQIYDEEIDFTCFNGAEQLTRTKGGVYYGGTYDARKEIPAATISAKATDRDHTFVPYDCDYKQVLRRERRESFLTLKNGYGFIVSERDRRASKQALHSADGVILSEFQDVPISATTLGFSRHAEVHTLYQPIDSKAALRQWEESRCLKIWLLTKAGDLSYQCLPPGPWMHEGPLEVLPTKNGLLVVSYVGSESGLYWIQDDQYYQLLPGSIRDLELSPDGCQVALVHQFDSSFKARNKLGELMHLNICQFSMK